MLGALSKKAFKKIKSIFLRRPTSDLPMIRNVEQKNMGKSNSSKKYFLIQILFVEANN
jgi:hypothetical protein